MARSGTKSRLFVRGNRWWADLRAFSDVGGKREPLIAPSESLATTDREVAEVLLGDRIRELHERRGNKALLGIEDDATVAEYAIHHLVLKAKSRKFTEKWLQESEHRLRRAVEFLGADRSLSSIGVKDVQKFSNWLQELPSPPGGTLSPGTVRHHLNSLSNLFKRAQSENTVPPGHNPVASLIDKPVAQKGDADWLEVHEAALLLEAARHHVSSKRDPLPFMYPLISTFLLTGGRKREVLGLEVGDVSFDRTTVTFRPNQWRTLKTKAARRSIPLFPQLEEILRAYVFDRDAPMEDGLLFQSPRTGVLVNDTRKALDAIAVRGGWKAGEIRLHQFRHTYCAARLQTLDHGAPVSPYTVGRELGHGGKSLVEQIYGHLGQVRHRADVVEYRIENHRDVLADQLKALGERRMVSRS